MRTKISLFLCIFGLCSISTAYGQAERFMATSIYNFTNYIDWPGGIGSSFVIAVMDDSGMVGELMNISKMKKVGSATITVVKIASPAEIGNAHVVYVSKQKKSFLAAINQSRAGKPTLIISNGATSDFGINFLTDDSGLKFQISKTNIESHKLKVSPGLINLGTLVK